MSAQPLIAQGSTEWLQARLGSLTASRVSDAFAKLKSGAWAKSREGYQLELVAERLTGLAADHYVGREALFGIEQEPWVVSAYENDYDVACELAGYIAHPTIEWAGASPDRLVGSDGLFEAKAPKSSTFVSVVLARKHGKPYKMDTDDGYVAQAMWQLACSERIWCDLGYGDPRMPIGSQLYVRRIERDDKLIAAMEAEARVFLDEVAELVAKVSGRG